MTAEDQARADQIRARADAATDGPWVRSSPHNVVTSERWRGPLIAEPMAVGNKANDATFIAAARSDVPWLLDRLAAEAATTERVRALHFPVIRNSLRQQCDNDARDWPCPTVRAIEGDR